ncbi:MAG: 50S ribosomal protein L19 [Phycisphaeraceae bacterium]|nr:50S ribosomal protein L19 [Phycisphaeraceae bacterium]
MASSVEIIESLNKDTLKTDIPVMNVGDTLNVHFRIVEGEKERIQVFQGVLIARSGRGINEMMTVRRIVDNMGVERMFPAHSPRVAKYEVLRRADSRRAKLYYLRDRQGKSRRLRDRRRGMKLVDGVPTVGGAVVEASAPAAAE